MDQSYLLMIYVTWEQENAIKSLFDNHGWLFAKQDTAMGGNSNTTSSYANMGYLPSQSYCQFENLDYRQQSIVPPVLPASGPEQIPNCCDNGGLKFSIDVNRQREQNHLDENGRGDVSVTSLEFGVHRVDTGVFLQENVDTENTSDLSSQIKPADMCNNNDNLEDLSGSIIASKENKPTFDSQIDRQMSDSELESNVEIEQKKRPNTRHTNLNKSENMLPVSCEVKTSQPVSKKKKLIESKKEGKRSMKTCNSQKQDSGRERKADVNGKKRKHLKEYRCEVCESTFKLQGAFNNHKRDGKCLFTCEYCGRVYRSRYYSNYLIHLKYHRKDRPYKCKQCGKSYTEKSSLTIHERTHSGEKPFVCDACGKTFHSSASLLCHKKCCHSDVRDTYQCELCGAKLGSSGYLAYHKRMVHTNDRPYECQICHKKFKTQKALEKFHATVHKNDTPFKCDMCPKSFKRKSYLTDHLRRHRNERTHFCETCGKGFYRQDDLEKHFRVHTGAKPFHCTVCDYKCALRENLYKHVKIHQTVHNV